MTERKRAAPSELPLRKVYMDRLQWLRALAALMVIFAHAQERLMIAHGIDDQNILNICWQFGHVGVATFFAISGFIMCHTTKNVAGGPADAWSFLRRRLIRILPLYYLATVAFLCANIALNKNWNLAEVVASVLFIPWQNSEGELYPIVAVGWTLNYEMLFYALFTIAVLLSSKWRWQLMLAILVSAVAFNTVFRESMPSEVAFWTSRYLLYFCVGISVFAITSGVGERWRLRLHPMLLFSIVAMCLLAVVLFNSGQYFHPLTFTIVAFALLLSVLQTDGDEEARSKAPARLLFLLGEASYASYLFHVLVLAVLIEMIDGVSAGIYYIVPVAIAIVAYGLCTILYLVVERPILNFTGGRDRASAKPRSA